MTCFPVRPIATKRNKCYPHRRNWLLSRILSLAKDTNGRNIGKYQTIDGAVHRLRFSIYFMSLSDVWWNWQCQNWIRHLKSTKRIPKSIHSIRRNGRNSGTGVTKNCKRVCEFSYCVQSTDKRKFFQQKTRIPTNTTSNPNGSYFGLVA